MFLNKEISVLFFWIFFSLILALILFSLSYFLVLRSANFEKLAAYECGFEPFADARATFDVRFFLISILFIIFDLEVMYLFPWALHVRALGYFSLLSVYFFLLILTVGFYYEWFKGALDWE